MGLIGGSSSTLNASKISSLSFSHCCIFILSLRNLQGHLPEHCAWFVASTWAGCPCLTLLHLFWISGITSVKLVQLSHMSSVELVWTSSSTQWVN
jgi:hypothetical protein